jgi:HlyD family secretion protein
MEEGMTEFDKDLAANALQMRRLLRWFVVSSLALCLGVGGWAVAAQVDSAVVTSGTFVVKSSAQAIQHLEGGVVGAILVKDGQLVQEGQVLVKLDAARVVADIQILDRKLIDLTAQKARLEAERQDQAALAPVMSPVADASASATLQAALAAQQSLLNERRSGRASQLSQLAERKRQIEAQLKGLDDQLAAVKDEMEQAQGDLEDKLQLDKKGLIRRPVLRQAERDVSRLRGQIGDMEARISSAKSELAETEFKGSEVHRTTQSEILSQLQATNEQLAQAEQERSAALDRVQRLEIRAPRTGYVHELAIHTVGGIIGPGQPLMQIIPANDPLIVSAKIRPSDIDQVHVGQRATVRISAFRMATPAELEGTVSGVSPDQITDGGTGPYFTVKIAVAPEEREKLQGKELTPGLPAEVLIRGEARRVITYLTQPLTDKIGLAFREK